MGVSGSGKSTVGKLLAARLGLPFYDGDDYHPEANIRKMASGNPLNDDDRHGWLMRLNKLIDQEGSGGLVLACSALKEQYRRTISKGLAEEPVWIFLEGSFQQILSRLSQRKDHYMPSALLESQFETLEVPDYGLNINIENTPAEIVEMILKNKQ